MSDQQIIRSNLLEYFLGLGLKIILLGGGWVVGEIEINAIPDKVEAEAKNFSISPYQYQT